MRILATIAQSIALTAAVLIASCASGPTDSSASSVPPTQQVQETTTSTSVMVVSAVDRAGRIVTLEKANGTQRAYPCGSGIVNFDQLDVGDRVNATITDSVVMFVRHNNELAVQGEAEPVDAWRGGAEISEGVRKVSADAAEVMAKILAVDSAARTITIESPGEMTTLPVDPGVDLRKFKKGDAVVLRVSESLIALEEIQR